MKKIVSYGITGGSLAWAFLAAPGLVLGKGDTVDLCTEQGTGIKIPCKSSLGDIVSGVVNIALFAAFVFALVFLIYGGIRWIMSGGDKEGTAKAKATVTSALIGLVIVIGSYILINVILGFFGSSLTTLTVPKLVTD